MNMTLRALAVQLQIVDFVQEDRTGCIFVWCSVTNSAQRAAFDVASEAT
jgi:hypothetical protein